MPSIAAEAPRTHPDATQRYSDGADDLHVRKDGKNKGKGIF